jgi:DNA-binding IclR family transcriptional regulator
VLAGELPLPEPGRARSAHDLRQLIAHVRREGVAVPSLNRPEPMTSVAAPVFDARQTAVAALSVVAPTASIEPPAFAPAVIAVARAVSRAVARL